MLFTLHIFLNENVWISIKISLKFVPKGQIDKMSALVEGLTASRGQAITWTNDDPVQWRICAWPGLNELRLNDAQAVSLQWYHNISIFNQENQLTIYHEDYMHLFRGHPVQSYLTYVHMFSPFTDIYQILLMLSLARSFYTKLINSTETQVMMSDLQISFHLIWWKMLLSKYHKLE